MASTETQERQLTAPETERAQADKSSETFVKEMHYQCYRIENLYRTPGRDAILEAAKTDPSILMEPLAVKFLYSYTPENASEVIREAKTKTEAERERLLEGVRRIIYRAKATQKLSEDKKGALTEEQKKAREDAAKESKRFEEMMKKELNDAEINEIESNISRPFDLQKGRVDMDKVQGSYKALIMGQKALGARMQKMQEKFGGAVSKIKEHEKKYGGVKNGNLLSYGYRKISSGLGWIGNKLGITEKAGKSFSDKTNEHIAEARKYYALNIDRIRNLQKNIDVRSAQVKDGLGFYKSDIREKLKELIGRADWAKAMQIEKEEAKKKMEDKKKELQEGLLRAQTQGREIDDAKKNTSGLGAKLKIQSERIKGGETSLDDRIKDVQERLKSLEQLYGAKDPRVVEMRKTVLVPLLEGKDKMAQVKNGTAAKLNDIEERNQKLDLLKADNYLSETQAVSEIEKLELAIKNEDKKIELLSKQRLELGSVIEGVEVAYASIDDFKKNVTTNLDKMTKDNKDSVAAVEKQYEFLKSANVKEPGFGSALWNTPLLGKWGALGVLDYGVNKLSGYVACLVKGKWDEKLIEEWSITGFLGQVNGKVNGWLDKGGFKAESWYGKILAGTGNFGAGVLSTGLGLVQGASMLVLQPHKVLDALGEMVTDWNKFKDALKQVIHYNDWAEGRFGAAAGRTAGDLIVLFFTAGSSAGAQAAATAGKAGATAAGRAAAYAGAFAKEIARQSVNGAFKITGFAYTVLRHPFATIGKITTTPLSNTYNWVKASVKGERQVYNLERAEAKLDAARIAMNNEIIAADINQVKGLLSGESVKILENLQKEMSSGAATAAKLSAQELQMLSKELSQALYRTSSWSMRNSIDKLGKGLQGYMKASAETTARAEVLFNSKFKEGTPVKVMQDGKLDEGWRIESIKPDGNVEVIKTAVINGRDYLWRKTLTKENVISHNRDLARGVTQTTEEIYATYFKPGSTISMPGDAPGTIWKIKQDIHPTDPRIIYIYNQNGKNIPVTKDAIVAWQLRGTGDIGPRLKQIGNERQALAGRTDEFAKLRAQELDFEESVLKLEAANKNAAAKVTNIPATNPALAPARIAQMGYLSVEGMKELGRFVVLTPFIPLAGFATFFRRLTRKETIAEVTQKLTDLKSLGTISTEINTLVKAGKLREAVHLYNASKIVAKDLGISFAAMDKSFLGYLHRAMPYTAVAIAGINKLADADLVLSLPEKTEVNLSEVRKMEKEHEEAYNKMIESEARAKEAAKAGKSSK